MVLWKGLSHPAPYLEMYATRRPRDTFILLLSYFPID
ncbi:hypothetical protein T4A_634 [Trichinella pseudospiralis]|uniref:Uncharacterized protein n=1 Tax=Trichinella pseudospiralis TaxID=6337 RepID=A0A0V1IGY3_TRIPS|nr:hypothetical protein T4A_634 [Trichinella pseudospiralis]KRY80320.1 hypothetical protein T4D_9909 [Trichinella pseudospiralis]KRZ21847.1 hypothetical protein T4C_8747 [Trichinella pseudospiralis]